MDFNISIYICNFSINKAFKFPGVLEILMNPKCLAFMEGVTNEIINIQMNSGQIVCISRILTQNFCINQSENPNYNHNKHPKNIGTGSMIPIFSPPPWFLRQYQSKKFNMFTNSTTKMSCCPPPASSYHELLIKAYSQLSPFFAIKLSYSPICL